MLSGNKITNNGTKFSGDIFFHKMKCPSQKTTVKSHIQGAPNPETKMFLVSSRSCLHAIHWSQVLSRERRYSRSSADRRCSNNIWVMNNFIAYSDASYIRDLTVSAIAIQADDPIDAWNTITRHIFVTEWTSSLNHPVFPEKWRQIDKNARSS